MADLHQHDEDNQHPHNHVSFVIDMFHQRLDQSQSQSHFASRSIEENRLFSSDRNFRVVEENDDTISNEFEADFGPGSGLGFLLENSDNPNWENDANLGFTVSDSDSGEDFFASQESDSDEEDESFQLCWDSFHLEDEIANPNPNANDDFEWEDVAGRIDEMEMFFGAEPDDASALPVILTGFEDPPEQHEQHDALEWQVLSNVRTFEPNTDSEDQYEDYNYAEYEMFFGQFADSDVSYSGRPPASKTAVVNLSTVLITKEDAANNNAFCAVCKDEVVVGEMATQLPCSHRYHGDCILPWLAVRNTCPVCRHELPTDDVDYERSKAERGGHA